MAKEMEGDSAREETAVRRASRVDVSGIVSSLCAAFDDDPVAMFVFHGQRRRRRGLAAFFRALLLGFGYLNAGEVWTLEGLPGAALWAPPGKGRPRPTDFLKLAPAIPFSLGVSSWSVLEFLVRMDARRPPEDHWYLSTLGVTPQRQHQGIGSRLMQPVLDKCDGENLPAYLESSKERNVSFYRSHGFEVVDELTARKGPTVWLMYREPR